MKTEAKIKRVKRVGKSEARKLTRRSAATLDVVIENQISRHAHAALASAARQARMARLSWMDVSNNELTQVSPDGTRTFVKSVAPGVRVTVGKKITLR